MRKTRERTRYELTDAGVDALRRWMEEPARVELHARERGKYLLLNHSLARAVVRAHEAWLDEVERELDQ